ncbi:MAG: hypothetical protein R2845_10720 [Thermomicrobiales bacterium]
MMPVALIQDLLERDWKLIEIPEHEYDTQATSNVATSAGSSSSRSKGTITRRRLEFTGFDVETYVGNSISLNRFGGPTCLSRPILRGAWRNHDRRKRRAANHPARLPRRSGRDSGDVAAGSS